MPRHDLEDSANGIADETKRDRLLASELIAKGEGEDGTAERAELAKLVRRVSIYFERGGSIPRNSSK